MIPRLRRSRSLNATFSYDDRGFLLAALENRGRAEPDAELELLVPRAGDRYWIARVDGEGAPAMETGEFGADDEEVEAGRQSLRWHETGLSLAGPNATTELRFFVGAVTSTSTLPVRLRVRGRSLGQTYEFSSLLTRTAARPIE